MLEERSLLVSCGVNSVYIEITSCNHCVVPGWLLFQLSLYEDLALLNLLKRNRFQSVSFIYSNAVYSKYDGLLQYWCYLFCMRVCSPLTSLLSDPLRSH